MNWFLLLMGVLGFMTFIAILTAAAWIGYYHLKDFLDSFERDHYR